MAAEVPEPVLPVPRGADPLQLGDGAAAAREAALRLQVSILSCHHGTALSRLSAHRDKFFLNGDAKYEHAKVRRWYMRYGAKIIRMYRTGAEQACYTQESYQCNALQNQSLRVNTGRHQHSKNLLVSWLTPRWVSIESRESLLTNDNY